MTRILFLSMLLPSVAFADYEATVRQCRAACWKAHPDDVAKRAKCISYCPPLGYEAGSDVMDAPPQKVVDWSEPAPMSCKPTCDCRRDDCRKTEPCCPQAVDDKPKKPDEKPAPAPTPKKPPPPQDNDQFKCEGHTCPQPVDPTQHSVGL